MPFTIVRNDITRMQVDVVVNSTSPRLSDLGGADGALHRAAGPELAAACRARGGIRPAEPLVTPGFRLPCRYVIHTVAPEWQGGGMGEEQELRVCYTQALTTAAAMGMETVAFPLMASGLFGFPKDKALLAATDAIRAFVLTHDMMVYLVVYDSESFSISEKLQADIRRYIDDQYVREHSGGQEMVSGRPLARINERRDIPLCATAPMPSVARDDAPIPVPSEAEPDDGRLADEYSCREEIGSGEEGLLASAGAVSSADDWEEDLRTMLGDPDESFAQQLLRRIDESGMTDPECYRRANIDRRLFSKIRSNPRYQPSKQTALAFAVALRLNRQQTDQLLRSAGLALSRSSYFDLIVAFFIERGIFDVLRINEALYAYDQPLLGN